MTRDNIQHQPDDPDGTFNPDVDVPPRELTRGRSAGRILEAVFWSLAAFNVLCIAALLVVKGKKAEIGMLMGFSVLEVTAVSAVAISFWTRFMSGSSAVLQRLVVKVLITAGLCAAVFVFLFAACIGSLNLR